MQFGNNNFFTLLNIMIEAICHMFDNLIAC